MCDLLVRAAAPKSDARPASATLLRDTEQVSEVKLLPGTR